MKLSELASYLDEFFQIASFRDSAINGLVFQGRKEVEKVALAVDSGAALLNKVAETGADMVVVHHGLFWGGITSIKGSLKERLRILMENDISLYSLHKPLDAHPELGNNIQIVRMLRAKPLGKVGDVAYCAELPGAMELGKFVALVESSLKTKCRVLNFRDEVKRVVVCSGAGWRALEEADNVDVLLTGEASHSAFSLAEDLGVSVVFAGHYATERPGLIALGEHLREMFGLRVEFVEHPSGL